MNAKNLLLAGLVLLCVVLVACLIEGRSPGVFMMPADAQNRVVSGGGYVATTASLTTNRQALWIIDNTQKTLIVYAFGATKVQGLQAVAKRDLRSKDDFGANLAGELMMIPGTVAGGQEAVYVIDPVGKQMIVYQLTETRGMEVLARHDLDKEFKAAGK